MRPESLVTLERPVDGVGLVILNRPEQLNSLSTDVVEQLRLRVADVAADPSLRAFVIAGEGKAFCAGADIQELKTLDGPHGFARFVTRLTTAFADVASCPKPSVAALHGVAFGGGLELALSCDLRVGDDRTRLGLPEIKLGLLPGAGGTARLPRLIPIAVAREMLLTGEPLSADRALSLGLLNRVVERDEVRSAAVALAASMAALAPMALAAAKRLMDTGATLSVDGAVSFERETVSMLFGTNDAAEGIAAFVEKRVAHFRGS